MSKLRVVALVSVLVVLASALQVLPREASERAAAAPAARTIPLDDPYSADFSRADTKGIGLRLSHRDSGYGIDLRLKGFRGSSPQSRGTTRLFNADPGVKVVYESSSGMVKEKIVLDQTSPSVFRFALDAGSLQAAFDRDGNLTLTPPKQPSWMFRIQKPVAWDRNGTNIPATMELNDRGLVVRLDPVALANATPPIVVDPTIEGARPTPPWAPQGRKLFQLGDGRLIFFHRWDTQEGRKIGYRISTDQGSTWGAPVAFADTTSPSPEVAVAHTPGDIFHVVYSNGSEEWPRVVTRKLTPSGTGWQAAPELTLSAAGSVWWVPTYQILDRGEGPAGRKLALGYSTYNSLLNQWDYGLHFSEDSGTSWVPAPGCSPGSAATLGMQGDRLICIQSYWPEVKWREWTGTGWSAPKPILGCCTTGLLPSALKTDDGSLHVVGELSNTVWHTFLEPGATDFAPVRWLGPGEDPVISTTGKSLFVYAHQTLSTTGQGDYFGGREGRILPYVATDGVNFTSGAPIEKGKAFDHVLTQTTAWSFADHPPGGDILFSLIDSVGGRFGNLVGESLLRHRLDSPDKQFSIGFVANQTTVDKIILWMASNADLDYRVGLQGDDESGSPDGNWLWGQSNGAPLKSYADLRLGVTTNMAMRSTDFNLPATTLNLGRRYHVVVAPTARFNADLVAEGGTPVLAPDVNSFADVEAVGADPQASYDQYLKFYNGAWPDSAIPGQVPHAVVSGPSGVVFSQELVPRSDFPILDYGAVGESILVPSTRTITAVRPYLKAVGNPTGSISLQLVDSENSQIWAQPVSYTPTATGWASITVPATTLAGGARYRLVAWSENRDPANYWGVVMNADLATYWQAVTTWDGANSSITFALNRPDPPGGFTDRSQEAKDNRPASLLDRDLVAFSSSGSDLLYLGGSQPFDFVTAGLVPWSPNGMAATSWRYWNGSSWAPLTLSRNDLLSAGEVEFTPPADWAQTTLDGRTAYWVRVGSTAGVATPIQIERLTSIRNLKFATAAERGVGYIPLAYVAFNALKAVEFDDYDALPPTVDEKSFSPVRGGNVAFASLPLLVNASDSGSALRTEGIVFVLQDVTAGTSTTSQAVSYDAVSGWAKTAQAVLQAGPATGCQLP